MDHPIDITRAKLEAESSPARQDEAEMLARVYDQVAKLVAAEIIGMIEAMDDLSIPMFESPNDMVCNAIKERFGL
jgi:hypothetical protein